MPHVAISRIILLTGEAEGDVLSGELREHNPDLDVKIAHTSADLAETASLIDQSTRLLSFCTSVIVPAEYLSRLPGPAYNFHPGPPERPGRYPSVFALFDMDPQFGITIHEMAPLVDSGAIVSANWFDIPENCDLLELESITLIRLVNEFRRIAPYLARFSAPLPHTDVTWAGRKTTKADCDNLCRITEDMSPQEITHRKRCCGVHTSQ